MAKFLINGKFLAQQVTGVQRYAREILQSLDSILGECDLQISLVAPSDAKDIPDFKNIKIVKKNAKASIIWDQFLMPLYVIRERAIGIHICAVGPIFKPDVVFLHDANVYENPQWFTKKIIVWYGLVHRACAKYAKKILTVSEFSKERLKKVFKIPDDKIINVGAAWQHMLHMESDECALNKFHLTKGHFYFSLGTKAPHKNLNWVFEYAKEHLQEKFAVSGSTYSKIFGNVDTPIPPNVHFLGYLSDAEIKSLMLNCKAFLFPSFYEGFGIPPLEAMSVGAPLIVSDIPVMHEIFGDSAHYFDPHNTNVDLDELLKQPVLSSAPILEKYSWEKSARKFLDSLKDAI
jgi:glycosyltransferase involved in cell wall biosynthesis